MLQVLFLVCGVSALIRGPIGLGTGDTKTSAAVGRGIGAALLTLGILPFAGVSLPLALYVLAPLALAGVGVANAVSQRKDDEPREPRARAAPGPGPAPAPAVSQAAYWYQAAAPQRSLSQIVMESPPAGELGGRAQLPDDIGESLRPVNWGAALFRTQRGELAVVAKSIHAADLVGCAAQVAFGFYQYPSGGLLVIHVLFDAIRLETKRGRHILFENTHSVLDHRGRPNPLIESLLSRPSFELWLCSAGQRQPVRQCRTIRFEAQCKEALRTHWKRLARHCAEGRLPHADALARYQRENPHERNPVLSHSVSPAARNQEEPLVVDDDSILVEEPEPPVPEPLPVVEVAIAAKPRSSRHEPIARPTPAPTAPPALGPRLRTVSRNKRVTIALIAVATLLAVIVGLLVWPTGHGSNTRASASQVPPQPAKGAERPAVSPTHKRKPARELNPWIPIRPPRNRALVLGLPKGHTGDGFHYQRSIRPPAQPYSIQQHEVTWKEVEPWLERNAPEIQRPPGAADDAPATGLDWKLAYDYCRSVGGRLPTEEQWEFAARGVALRKFSWGDRRLDLQLTHVYAGEGARPRPVKSSDQDVTPEGIHDLIGNAQEWTADLWRASDPGGDESWVQAGGRSFRAVRGLPLDRPAPDPLPEYGAAFREPLCSRGDCISDTAMRTVGFRCAKEPS